MDNGNIRLNIYNIFFKYEKKLFIKYITLSFFFQKVSITRRMALSYILAYILMA